MCEASQSIPYVWNAAAKSSVIENGEPIPPPPLYAGAWMVENTWFGARPT